MRKIIVILALFLSFFSQVFSLSSEIFVDKEEVSIWENFRLTLTIKNSENLENIEISQFNNLENDFDIIWQSQSNKFFSQVVNINWKLEEKREIITDYTFTLSPKRVWSFEIWPIIVSEWDLKNETNSLKIKVFENEIKSNFDDNYVLTDKKQEKIEEKKSIVFDKKIIYFIIFLIIFLIWIFIIYRKYFSSKKVKNLEKEIDFSEKIEEKKSDFLEKHEDFDNFLNLENKEFFIKIEKILKNFIFSNYSLETKNKSISEIISDIKNPEKKEFLKKINENLNKIRFSDLEIDKTEIIEDLKNFLKK